MVVLSYHEQILVSWPEDTQKENVLILIRIDYRQDDTFK